MGKLRRRYVGSRPGARIVPIGGKVSLSCVDRSLVPGTRRSYSKGIFGYINGEGEEMAVMFRGFRAY
jgi:hypothetical protein